MDAPGLLAVLVGATEVEELAGGHQARVFRARRGTAGAVVVKAVDATLVDRRESETRADVTRRLAQLEPAVCAPIPIGGHLVTPADLDGRAALVTVVEHAPGTPPDPAVASDVRLVGRLLARLHAAMRTLGPVDLPVVAALRDHAPTGPVQLLHGDVSVGNVRIDGGAARIFDFDDCGHGPVAFDLANAIYMDRFDAVTGPHPRDHRVFADALVDGYASGGGGALAGADLEPLVALRVSALGAWLDDLSTAPIGIRTASPAWHRTLRRFVADQA